MTDIATDIIENTAEEKTTDNTAGNTAEEKPAMAGRRPRKVRTRRPPRFFDGELHQQKYLLVMAAVSLFLYLYIETFARATKGLGQGLLLMKEHPVVFLYNWLIIFATLSIALLFRRRRFYLFIIAMIWFGLGTTNGLILMKRMTPFTLYDVQNLGDGLSIITTYFSTAQIVLGGAALFLIVVLLILFFISSPKWQNINYVKSFLTVGIVIAVTVGATLFLLQKEVLSTFFGNLNYAYRDYGFPYCFINTSLNTGIARPDDYSESSIQTILEKKTQRGTNRILPKRADNKKYPNIIILQMESFTVADDYNHISVDRDPTPVFNALSKKYSSGRFEVPACGAGTANTEFEVLTGISAKFFGPGEYPYKGKLRDQTLESMAYILRSHGYTASALHNHRALFYNRNEVYADLGFDSYTSVEYMNNLSKTPTGWTKDKVMTGDIMEILNETPGRDFLHIISVEGHGSYPTYQVFRNPYTTVTAEDEEIRWRYEYYLNECHEMDTFIGDLIARIEETGEPTIILIYGDHIPALDVAEEEYSDGNLYKTRYVIWDNIGLPKQDADLTSYEVGAVLLERSGLGGEGVLFDYQQSNDRSAENYLSDQKALAYDMLYGKRFVFGGKNPYKRIDMKMGHKEIKIVDIVKIGQTYYIQGENFTEHSRVSMDGDLLDTIYLSPTLLGLREPVDPADAPRLEVSQIDTKDDTILTTIRYLEEL